MNNQTHYAITPEDRPSLGIAGSTERFPVRRIYCVGQNYAEHAREMGTDPDRVPPCFFSKPANSVVGNGAAVPYPPRTRNLHHEVELVVAIGQAGRAIPADTAAAHIFGYAVGNDLTRRDLQKAAKDGRAPWDTAKGFDHAAPITDITPVGDAGLITTGRIWLAVNGDLRQEANISDLVWSIDEVIAELSTLFELKPGDLIFTGTPAGVGPLQPGDTVVGGVGDLPMLSHTIVEPA